MLKTRRKKHQNYGVISLISIGVILMIGGNFLLGLQIEKQVNNAAQSTLQAFSSSITQGARSWMSQIQTISSVWSSSRFTHDSIDYLSGLKSTPKALKADTLHEEIATYFHVLLEQNDFQSYALVDRDNTILSSNIASEIGRKSRVLEFHGRDQSLHQTALIIPEQTVSEGKSDFFIIVVPVTRKTAWLGSLLLEVNAATTLAPLLQAIQQDFYQHIVAYSRTQLFIPNHDIHSGDEHHGQIVPIKSLPLAGTNIETLMMRSQVETHAIDLQGYENADGEQVIAYYQWLDDYNFGIAYEIEKHALYSQLTYIQNLLFGITVLLTMLGIAVLRRVIKSSSEFQHQVHEKTRDVTKLHTQLNLILDSAGEGICGLDRDGNCIFINSKAASLLGYDEMEVLGQPLHELIHHSPESEQPHVTEDCPMHKSVAENRVYEVYEDRFWKRDGGSIPVEYVSSPLHEEGQVHGSVVIFRDISKKLEIDRMKEEFISTVSHELRTPLTAIKGAVELIDGTMKKQLGDGLDQMLTIAKRNSARLLMLINDILDISKLENKQMNFNYEDLSVTELLKEAIALNQEYGGQLGVHYKLKEVEKDRIRIDPDRFQQVMSNLLSNASKFSTTGGHVEVGSRTRGHSSVIFVRDFGNGIPEEFQKRIFNKFSQADSSDTRKIGGTGLGLAITKLIVEGMHGEIWFESEATKGTTFYLAFPHSDSIEHSKAS